MKIAFVSALYPPNTRGGGELSTHYIALGLVARGHDVTVITSGNRPEKRVVQGVKVQQLAVPLDAKPLLEQRHSRRCAAILAREIDFNAFDVVHAHDFRSAQALSELGLKNPVVTVRDYAQICGSPNNILADGTTCPGCDSIAAVFKNRSVVEAPWWRKPFRVWQYRYNIGYRLSSFRKFKHHIYISRAQQAEVAKIQDLQGIATQVIYNPVAPDYLATPPVRSLGRKILYVGTVESYKGVGLLLEAFASAVKKHSDIELVIVGEGNQRPAYQSWVEKHGLQYRVRFVGRVAWDRMRRLYDEAQIVVAPHVWIEPFGRTVVEAMARGKVVIAAAAGGPGGIIKDGQTGFLFTRGAAPALTEKLDAVLGMGELDRREVGTRARQWVMENLTIDQIAAQHEALYQKL